MVTRRIFFCQTNLGGKEKKVKPYMLDDDDGVFLRPDTFRRYPFYKGSYKVQAGRVVRRNGTPPIERSDHICAIRY